MKTHGTEFYYMDEDNEKFKKTNAHDITKEKVNPLFKTLEQIYDNVSTKKHHFVFCFQDV